MRTKLLLSRAHVHTHAGSIQSTIDQIQGRSSSLDIVSVSTETMKVVLALLAICVAAASANFEFTEEWELWKKVWCLNIPSSC